MSIGEASIGLNLGTAQLDVDVRKAEQILNKIGRGVIANGKQAEKAIEQLSSAGVTSVDRLQRAFNTLNLKSGLDIENEKRRVTAAFDQIKNSGVASAKEIERAHASMKSKLDGIDAPIKNAAGSFGGLTSAAVAFGAGFSIQQVITQLHAAGMAAERLRNSFEAATGSAAKGKTEFGFVRSEANRLGLDLLTTSDAYLKLTAASRGTALEGQKTRDIFTSVAGAGRALGLSGEQMGGALQAIQQMMSKGTVQAEELRGQLGERLPGAFNIAARAMGVTTAELGKMLEGGKVISEEFLPLFAAELQKTFPPGEKAMTGMTAETMRLKTAWYELKTTVMEGGGETIFTLALREMSKELRRVESGFKAIAGIYNIIRHPLTPEKVDVKTLPPLTAFDTAMTGIPETGTGIGSLVERGRVGKLTPMMPVDAEARAAQAAEMLATERVTKTKDTYSAFENDHYKLLIQGIEEYNKKLTEQEKAFYDMGQEAELTAQSAAAVFNINTMQGGDLKTDRYKVTPLSKYRLNTAYHGISQTGVKPISPEEATVDQERVNSFNSSMDANIKRSSGDTYGAEKDQLLKEYADREKSIADMLQKGVMTVEEANAAKLKSDETYAAAKKKLDEGTAKQAIGSLGDSLSSLGSTLMQGNKEQFEAGKKAAIAGATVQMMLGAVNAYTSMTAIPLVGPALGALAAAAVVAAGTQNIAMISSQQYEGRALGGPVNAGQTYIVNENRSTQGPEYFTPSVSGTITPANKMGGSSTSVTQVLQISAGVPDAVRAEMARMMPLIRSQAVSAVKQAQRGGLMQ